MFLGLEILSIAVYVLAGMHLRRLASQEAAHQVLRARRLLVGVLPLRHRPRLRRHRLDQPGRRSPTSWPTTTLADNGLLLAGFGLLLVGLRVQGGGRAVPLVDARRLPGLAHARRRLHGLGREGGRLRRAAPGLRRDLRRPTGSTGSRSSTGSPSLSLLVGAVLAVVQTDVKRMLAYSSINHAGFILVGVRGRVRRRACRRALFYLAAYTFMVGGTFGVVTARRPAGRRPPRLDDYRGLSRREPLLALAFTVFLLAQAGVPLTSGFLAKFYVIAAAVEARSYWLALVAMLSAVISAFLYLRIVLTMYAGADDEDEDADAAPAAPARLRVPVAAAIALVVAVVVTIGIGFVPDPAHRDRPRRHPRARRRRRD